MERFKKRERSVTPEKKRRIDSPNNNNARDRQKDERSSRKSVPRQRDTSRDTSKRVDESSKSRRKPIDTKPSPKPEPSGDRKQGERQNGTGRHRKVSVNEIDDEDARSDSNKNSDTVAEVRPEPPVVMPQRFVHDSSSISRTPSPFLSAAERDPELMIGTLVEKLALKRQLQKTKQGVAKEVNSSSEEEEEEDQRDAPKRSKFESTAEEGGGEAPKTSSKKAKKAKKSKKSKKSKKEKRGNDLEGPDSRDALEKQLRERALKSLRKHKLAE